MLKSCRGGVARDIATLLGPTWFGVGELGIGLSSIAWSATESGAKEAHIPWSLRRWLSKVLSVKAWLALA